MELSGGGVEVAGVLHADRLLDRTDCGLIVSQLCSIPTEKVSLACESHVPLCAHLLSERHVCVT